MTGASAKKILATANSVVAAHRAWLEATAETQRLYKAHADAEVVENKLGDELAMARHDHLIAVYDSEERFVQPAPHYPPRCVKCGQHEKDHPLFYGGVLHAFEPQSPGCHRAHPHQEPCGPEPKR